MPLDHFTEKLSTHVNAALVIFYSIWPCANGFPILLWWEGVNAAFTKLLWPPVNQIIDHLVSNGRLWAADRRCWQVDVVWN